jgi:hypothetical protein
VKHARASLRFVGVIRPSARATAICGARYDAQMLLPLIGARLHGWLDDLVVVIYVLGALLIPLEGAARAAGLAAAVVHFLLTRFTDYPHGTFKWIPFRTHAFIELGEGIVLIAMAAGVLASQPPTARAFLVVMGVSQLGAFAFSDYEARRG